jgi:hypothetical protein
MRLNRGGRGATHNTGETPVEGGPEVKYTCIKGLKNSSQSAVTGPEVKYTCIEGLKNSLQAAVAGPEVKYR